MRLIPSRPMTIERVRYGERWFPYLFRHTDGSWHWALDRAYVVDRAPDGSTKRVLGLVVDITARKIRETALSAADQRFRAIARELRCVIYEIDAESGISTGEGVERVIGYTNADLPGPGDWAALVRSIQSKLFPLGGDYRLLPGHGPETTLERERRDNPFVGVDARLSP